MFTETGLPQDCTMTATAVWWVSFFGSLTFFLYFNIWAADPCSWSDFMRGRPTWRCTPLSDTYQLALRLNHWYYIYDHFPVQVGSGISYSSFLMTYLSPSLYPFLLNNIPIMTVRLVWVAELPFQYRCDNGFGPYGLASTLLG